jgi:hypothetical protein
MLSCLFNPALHVQKDPAVGTRCANEATGKPPRSFSFGALREKLETFSIMQCVEIFDFRQRWMSQVFRKVL